MGQTRVQEGEIDFEFLNVEGQKQIGIKLNKSQPYLVIPPGSWHKIIPGTHPFKADLQFYCMPHRYFNKKYGLGTVHQDLFYIYQTYLNQLGRLIALDVGCGSGRNLLYLAKMGYKITGIDHNQVALDKLQGIIDQEALSSVDTQLHDLNRPLPLEDAYYDFVFSTVSLQFLNADRVPILLAELKNATKVNGYHFLVFPLQSELYSLPNSFTFLPQTKALYHLYQDSGWAILEYKESIGHLHKLDAQGRPIAGLFALLLAQKIG